MKFFELLNHKHELPEMYEGIVTKDEYNDILAICIEFHKENEIEILNIEDGGLHIDSGEYEQWRYLDNLVRILAKLPVEEWRERIYFHFSLMAKGPEELDKTHENFETEKEFLRVLIKDDDFMPGDSINDFIYRVDFPETRTFLVSEAENLFHYLRKDHIENWDISEEELFEIAISNIPIDEIELQNHDVDDKYEMYGFYGGDFAASIILDLKNRAEFTIGTYGSIVAIPAKGTAVVYPIENNDVGEFIVRLYPDIMSLNHESEGAITSNFYWFYNDVFHIISIKEDEKGKYLSIPEELKDLFIEYKN